jgi:putative protease
LDALCTGDDPAAYRADLFHVSHREYCTGFYFGRNEVERPTEIDYLTSHIFLGIIGPQVSDGLYELDIRNQIAAGQTIEYIGPDLPFIEDSTFELMDENGGFVKKADHEHVIRIKPGVPVQPGYIIRRREAQQSPHRPERIQS